MLIFAEPRRAPRRLRAIIIIFHIVVALVLPPPPPQRDNAQRRHAMVHYNIRAEHTRLNGAMPPFYAAISPRYAPILKYYAMLYERYIQRFVAEHYFHEHRRTFHGACLPQPAASLLLKGHHYYYRHISVKISRFHTQPQHARYFIELLACYENILSPQDIFTTVSWREMLPRHHWRKTHAPQKRSPVAHAQQNLNAHVTRYRTQRMKRNVRPAY